VLSRLEFLADEAHIPEAKCRLAFELWHRAHHTQQQLQQQQQAATTTTGGSDQATELVAEAVEADYSRAAELWRQAALKGNAEAARMMGHILAPVDPYQAVQWYHQAARHGDVEATAELESILHDNPSRTEGLSSPTTTTPN
jgi:TPR repeat protein